MRFPCRAANAELSYLEEEEEEATPDGRCTSRDADVAAAVVVVVVAGHVLHARLVVGSCATSPGARPRSG